MMNSEIGQILEIADDYWNKMNIEDIAMTI